MSDQLMAQVKSTIVTCTNCWLHQAGHGPVPYRGPAPAKLVVVGEAPGDVEDRERQPFVGRAGKWMQRAISDTHINLAHVGWCNVVSCWPGKTKKGYRVPAVEERDACETNLKMQLVAADPYLVILAGGTALNAFRPGLKITQVRGRPFWLPGHRGVLAVPTFHPAAVLRVHELKTLMAKDLRQARWRLRRLERGISQSSRWPEDCTICHKPVEHYDRDGLAWCARHFPVDIDNDSSAVPQTLDV